MGQRRRQMEGTERVATEEDGRDFASALLEIGFFFACDANTVQRCKMPNASLVLLHLVGVSLTIGENLMCVCYVCIHFYAMQV